MAEGVVVGLIGYGMAGRVFHAPVIASLPQMRLKKVVERRTQDSRARYPAVEVVRDAGSLLEDDEIELVVVATPNSTHFELARDALLAGKHVVVDKPFTTTFEQARQLTELARSRARVLSVYHNRRWDGDFLTVKKLLASGLLGRLVEYEAHYDRFRDEPRPGAWREMAAGAGGGILFDLGSHLIDQAQVLFGLPRMVTADVRTQREFAEADDSFDLTLHYDSLKVSLRAGMLVREPRPRFVLHGTAGAFVKHGTDPQEQALQRGLTPSVAGWGEEPRELWGTVKAELGGLHVEGRVETLAGNYQDYYRNIVEAIAGRAEPTVKPEEAANTIRIIELARQSSDERRTISFSP